MNICIAYPNNPLSYSETFIQNHINGLKPEYSLTGGRWPYLTESGKSIFKFPYKLNVLRGLLKAINSRYYHKVYSYALSSYIKQNGIEVILAEYGPVGVSMMDACQATGTRLVVHFHGYDAFYNKTVNKFKSSYSLLNTYAHAIVVVSNPMKQQLVSMGINSSKVVRIPYGIDINVFSGASQERSEKLFIAVGRFTAKKAPLMTIKAFEAVYRRDPKVRMMMIGDGELLKEAKAYVAKRNLNECVIFKGVLTSDEIIKKLQKARAFVQHSVISDAGDSEGLPNSILEALSCGLPVVSTNHAGIPEVVEHGKNGFLVDEGDVVSMSNYMFELAHRPELAAQLGRFGRTVIENEYSLIKQIQILKSILIEDQVDF